MTENLEDIESLKWNLTDDGKCGVDGCPCMHCGSCANCPLV